MSFDAVVRFLDRLEADTEFKDRCRVAFEEGGSEAVVGLAAGQGFEFSADELAGHVGGADELGDDALDRVAGGRAGPTPRVIRGAFARTFGSMLEWSTSGDADDRPTEE